MATDLRLRESDEIQGDIIAGFKKDNVSLLFLKFEDQAMARGWLRGLAPQIATTRQVAAFNDAFSEARRTSGGDDPRTLKATWLSVSLTYPGMRELSATDPFEQPPPVGSGLEAFMEGSARRAGALGDTGDNSPEFWLFGNGRSQPVHAVLTIASDTEDDLRTAVDAQRLAAAESRIVVVYQQNAKTLLGSRRGKEHFGFKDGISEPGVRFFDRPDPARPGEVEGHPGSRIIPAGEFVCGEQPAPGSFTDFPEWARNGSFQVVRRLAQDVPGWWSQVSVKLKELKQAKAVPESATSEWLAARMVGRWRSGAPVCHHPDRDVPNDPTAASDNDFDFRDDLEGLVTPLWSHLRKTSPRAGLQEDPAHPPFDAEVLDGRRIMRRGAPYGHPFDPASEGPGGPDDPRGLLFVCYQADIARQFEFIQADWMDQPDFPPKRNPLPGKDPVTQEAPDIDFESRGPDGAIKHTPLSFAQFVRTTGSVYAFAPSISTLRALADGRLVGRAQQGGQGGQTTPAPARAYPVDAFVAVPDRQRQGGQTQFWACHGDRYRKISVDDGSAHTDRTVKGDTVLSGHDCFRGIGRIDCVLPMPDLQNPGGKSWYWTFHSTGGRQQYRTVSVTCGSGHTGALERADRDLTAWNSLAGVDRVDCFLPVPDQQRIGGKSWYWVFHTTGGRQRYRLISIADGAAHTDVIERTDRELSQWTSLGGITSVDCFLPVPDLQRVGGRSEYWVFHGESYRRIAVNDGSGHPDRQVAADRSCSGWNSLI
ncbi:Dyp-type peroxidase [Kitasatospora sp. A2-31]|uniref:Dyp-type peroxidase n=1 Tax=Kitasatospora sp. A2-31 TaxID=2916414 RepID=UPI001EE7AB4C|nr:Dyp-type peroxidase [Kitasatospora sp. A2-31]MCG6493480.1 Dyp-type peroxidase [Kitasatospora sp. A2-31]